VEYQFDEIFAASLCVYAGGFVAAVQTSGRSTTWTIDIPQFDWESVLESNDDSATVVLSLWIRAFKTCQHYAATARRDISGRWASERYVRGLRDKPRGSQ
jgi:hypothetical protein